MTKQEFSRLAEIIKAFYPRDLKLFDNDIQREAWFFALGDMDYASAQAAVIEHAKTSQYPPSIADIRREYDYRTKPKPKTALQAYINVKKAIQKYGYYQPEETYAMLDKQEQQALKAFGFVRFNNAPDNEFTQREFEKYYNAVCNDLVVV